MEETIIEELQNTYEDFLHIEIEYITIRTYKIYVSINFTEFKNDDKIRAVEFTFIWDKNGTIESNINQLKYKINKSIVRLCLKRGEYK